MPLHFLSVSLRIVVKLDAYPEQHTALATGHVLIPTAFMAAPVNARTMSDTRVQAVHIGRRQFAG